MRVRRAKSKIFSFFSFLMWSMGSPHNANILGYNPNGTLPTAEIKGGKPACKIVIASRIPPRLLAALMLGGLEVWRLGGLGRLWGLEVWMSGGFEASKSISLIFLWFGVDFVDFLVIRLWFHWFFRDLASISLIFLLIWRRFRWFLRIWQTSIL